MSWIKLEPGCPMPEIDEFVLWHTEDGNYFVCEIDKDDTDWWNGTPINEGTSYRPICTHWKRIHAPGEEPDQEILWDEIRLDMTGGVFYFPKPDIVCKWSQSYTLIRK